MKILRVADEPFHELTYLSVTNGSPQVVEAVLPFLTAEVDLLPPGLQAVVAASDLQGREQTAAPVSQARLLGLRLAEELQLLAEVEMIPSLSATGVILAGDLYCRQNLDRRGGSGDVRAVWEAFASCCRWVAGVAGNHDVFGDDPLTPAFAASCSQPKMHLLDGQVVVLDGLKIAGMSGIIGNPRRPFRRDEAAYLRCLESLLDGNPDLLVLHEGPDVPGLGYRGLPPVREALEATHRCLVVRGHAAWNQPLATLVNGTQVLNVDARVVVLIPAKIA